MKTAELLKDLCKEISVSKLEDSIGELSKLTLFELQNLRTTAAQHNIVNFLIEFRKVNTGMIGVKDIEAEEHIKKFYEKSLMMNSPVTDEVIL